MTTTTLFLLLAGLGIAAFLAGRERALKLGGGAGAARSLHSLPAYYGYFSVLYSMLPALALVSIWVLVEERLIMALVAAELPADYSSLTEGQLDLFLNTVRNAAGAAGPAAVDPAVEAAANRYRSLYSTSHWLVAIAALALVALGQFVSMRAIRPALRARNRVESIVEWFLLAASTVAILATIGIVLSVLFEALRFFEQVPLGEFLFGTTWSPQSAVSPDAADFVGSFGIAPLLLGTFVITAIAMLVAIPVGVMSAIYMAEYAADRTRAVMRPLLEVLAGIPTVVYGFFAVLTIAPWIRDAGLALGLHVASESALAAGIVMGVMIIPLVSSLSDDAIRAVPAVIREGALALGATRSEAVLGIILPAAMPGILGGVLLAVSRAIGETMIVVMAASLAANLTVNPLEAVTTVTVQIVTLLVGDQEFESARTLAAFALGLVLFIITMLLNVLGLNFVRRYRERYE